MNSKKIIIGSIATTIIVLTSGCSNQTSKLEKIFPVVQHTNNHTKNTKESVNENDYLAGDSIVNTLPVTPFTQQTIEGLLLMREEEKLARDVYQALGEKWNIGIFSNIANSEQTHTNAVKAILERHNITDPVHSDTRGVFSRPELQKLYNDLITIGQKSLLDALTVGATVEDLDIADLQKLLASEVVEDIRIVYQNLLKGSRNHLRAFVRQIEKNGGSYTPQHINIADYTAIITSPQEAGPIDKNSNSISGTGHGEQRHKNNKQQ